MKVKFDKILGEIREDDSVWAGSLNDKWYFVDPAALNAAYPVGQIGWYSVVWSTDTIWVWDDGTNSWVNTNTAPSLVWWNITWAISNQTDLQAALNAKVAWPISSVIGNIPLMWDTSGDSITDSWIKLVSSPITVTVWDALTPTLTSALTYLDTLDTIDISQSNGAAVTVQLPSSMSTLPFKSGWYPLNKLGVSIIWQSPSAQIGNVAVVWSLGSATLTFGAALPAQALVDGAVKFITWGTSFSAEWLSAAFRITNIVGQVVTIDTPGITLPNDAGNANKKVVFIPSTVLVQTSGTWYKALQVQHQYSVFVNVAFFHDANGKANSTNSIINVTAWGSVNVNGCAFVNCGCWVEVWRGWRWDLIVGTTFSTCLIGALVTSGWIMYEWGTSAARTSFNGCVSAISATQHWVTRLTFPEIQLTTTNRIMASSYGEAIVATETWLTPSITGTYSAITWGKILGVSTTTPNIPFDVMQSDWSIIGKTTKAKYRTITASELLTFKSEKISVNSASPQTVTLPSVSTDVTLPFSIQNQWAGIVTIQANDGKLISWSATLSLSQWQAADIELIGGTQWIIK